MKEGIRFRRTFFPIRQVSNELAGWVLSIGGSLPIRTVRLLSFELL